MSLWGPFASVRIGELGNLGYLFQNSASADAAYNGPLQWFTGVWKYRCPNWIVFYLLILI